MMSAVNAVDSIAPSTKTDVQSISMTRPYRAGLTVTADRGGA